MDKENKQLSKELTKQPLAQLEPSQEKQKIFSAECFFAEKSS